MLNTTSLAVSTESTITMPFNLERIGYLKSQGLTPELNEISLQVLQEYFEQEILPYKYTYHCNYNLSIDLSIKTSNFCHLIFGTVEDKVSKGVLHKYVGQSGYDYIKSGQVTMDNIPVKIKQYAKLKLKAFIYLSNLLDNAKVIHFNPILTTTIIKSDFVLYRNYKNLNLNLFLRTLNRKTNLLSGISFISSDNDYYIKDQLKFDTNSIVKK